MFKGSIHSLYGFKEPLRHLSYRSVKWFYEFNSFIDYFEGNYFNSDKMSWYARYYMDSDEGDHVYISANIMGMC